MIAKFLPTPTFKAATRYVLDRDPDLRHAGAHTIETNMDGRQADELTREFGMVAAGNPKVHLTVAHIVMRTAPEDRLLTDQEWSRIAGDYLDRLGYTNTPYLVVRHPEPDQHVHVVASRVRYDGSRVEDYREHRRSRRIVRELERRHHLVHTQEPMHVLDRAREQERDEGRVHERSWR